jgi:hypothetical protein
VTTGGVQCAVVMCCWRFVFLSHTTLLELRCVISSAMEVISRVHIYSGTHRDTEYTHTTCVDTSCHLLIFHYKINKAAEPNAVGSAALIVPTLVSLFVLRSIPKDPCVSL